MLSGTRVNVIGIALQNKMSVAQQPDATLIRTLMPPNSFASDNLGVQKTSVFMVGIGFIRRQNTGLGVVFPVGFKNKIELLLNILLVNLEHEFNAPVKVALHPVGGGHEHAGIGIVIENINA